MIFEWEDCIVEPLKPGDEQSLQQLFEESSDFFELVEGHPPYQSAAVTLTLQLPSEKTYDDKFVLGIYEKETNKLIGVIDLIKGFPEEKCFFIGFMLIGKEFRDKGLGQEIIIRIKEDLEKDGFEKIKVSVASQNKQGIFFWKKLGFKEYDQVLENNGGKISQYIKMEVNL